MSSKKKRIHVLRVKEWLRITLVVILFLLIFTMLLRFDAVAEPLAKVIGTTKDKVQEWAGNWYGIAFSLGLIALGVIILGLPLVTTLVIALVVVAGALMLREGNDTSLL